MFQLKLKTIAAALTLSVTAHNVAAVIAQEPLLNRPNTVAPNLTVILDTSGSMDGDYIYQYGRIDASGMGPQGPESSESVDRPAQSPDVNRIYYDPRVRYLPRVDYLGADLATNPPTPKDPGWRVYFRDITSAPTTDCPSGAYTTNQLVLAACYYNPYAPPASELASGASTTVTYPNRIRSTTSNSALFPKFKNRTDCITPTAATATSCTLTEEAQNHSNWLKWYSTRGSMAVTSLGAAFQPLKDDSIRLGYTTIKNINDNSRLDRGVSSFSPVAGGTKALFFTWLYGRTWASGTPNRVAVDGVGQYYSRTDDSGPWATTPDPASKGIAQVGAEGTGHASCRRSFSMLITDGYTNGGAPTVGNVDRQVINIPNANGVFPYKQPITGTVAAAPYTDTYSNTMADIAMKYWGQDLRTLANKVPAISTTTLSNPSTWQNVSFYAVTLGIDGSLARTPTVLTNLKNGTQAWPQPVDNQPTTIDDLWHATINARGELLNANNSSELTSGLNRMFETIAGLPQTLSGVAVSTTFLKNGTRKYKPEYIPGTWTGKLSAIELNSTTGNDQVPINTYWQVESGVDSNGDPISLIPAAAARNIVTWTGSNAATFNTTNSGLSADIVNYIRGDSTKELRNAGGIYRNRTAKLGDIVNSSPVYILDNVDLNYEKLGFTNYRTFVASKVARTEGVLFVGANDGMLHGFRNSTGAEVFAFIPKAVIPNLYKLTETPYVHQYYVDGPLAETDAYLDSNWKNILMGTAGAGAKAVFALDVTTPTAMSATSVLWEVNSTTTGFSNLAHILSNVEDGKVEAIGTLPNDDWVAVFGNGFGSSSGVASLFVVNLKTGALLKEIVADSTGSNGLGGVRIVRDSTQRIIGAYAGDLKGNLWKFDLAGNDKTLWKVGLSGATAPFSPLYAAGSTQSISATPAVVPHPNGGYVVTFGTGRFFESTDTTAPFVTQRLYGVWDKQTFGATTIPAGASVTGVTSLQQQTISTVTASGVDYYAVSANPVSWGNGLSTGMRGWYIDLPNSGQRVAYPLERLFEKSGSTFVLASTISPVSSASADLCVQSGSGSGWVYLIDGITGAGATKRTLDTNNDGQIDNADAIVSGYQDPVDGRPTAISIGSGGGNETGCIVTAQNTCIKFELKCGQAGMPACPPNAVPGAVTLKKREWRQLFMR